MSQLCCTWWLTGPWGPGNFCFLTESGLGGPAQVRSVNGMTGLEVGFLSGNFILFCSVLTAGQRENHIGSWSFLYVLLDPSLILQRCSEQAHHMHKHISQICTCMFENQPQDLCPSQGSLGPLLECCMTSVSRNSGFFLERIFGADMIPLTAPSSSNQMLMGFILCWILF